MDVIRLIWVLSVYELGLTMTIFWGIVSLFAIIGIFPLVFVYYFGACFVGAWAIGGLCLIEWWICFTGASSFIGLIAATLSGAYFIFWIPLAYILIPITDRQNQRSWEREHPR
jgi:hypothetical protein